MGKHVICVSLVSISLALLGGCSDTKKAPANASGTGAFGIITVGGRQKMYLPLSAPATGNAQIAVVDVGVRGNGTMGASALITNIDLGANMDTLNPGQPASGASTTGGDATLVIAASTRNRQIWFIDPTQDRVTGTLLLDMNAGQSGFSGGGGYVTGIATDSANHRAILSVWNGFAIVDFNTKTITRTILAAPSENFGFDSVNSRIIAPFYQCRTTGPVGATPPPCASYKTPNNLPILDGLNVIDLKDFTVYTYQDSMATNPAQPVGSLPDSAAIDASNGIALIPSEGRGDQNVIDFSRATFDKGSGNVTAPHQYVRGLDMEGVSIEPSSHFAFFEHEFSASVAVMNVLDANRGAGSVDGGIAAAPLRLGTMPNLPSGGAFANIGDPHGIAVTSSILDSKAVGFVVDTNRRWVARVDLAAMAALRPVSGVSLTAAEMAPVVTYLDGQNRVGSTPDGGR